ncbi:MAG: quinoprotein amine dehydrogenase [Rikenellaceae bacterium]|nr:quinoprotein amine dehydrogenase [Rikenellaceae bacterium]
MKRFISACLAIGAFALSSCEKEVSHPGVSETYTSHWYYSYEAIQKIDNKSVGLADGEFTPYTVTTIGDTLLISTLKANNLGNYGIILFDLKTNKPIRTINSWTVNGETQSFVFAHKPNDAANLDALLKSGDRLYVFDLQSSIHAFQLPSLEYICCIGNGNWNNQVFQAQAGVVKDGLIFARDKDGKISTYKEELIKPENNHKITRYRYSAIDGGSSNNGFNAHYMQVVDDVILLSDYEKMCIRTIDPSLVNDQMKNGTSLDVHEKLFKLPFKPRTFALTKDRIYLTGNNSKISIYDRNTHDSITVFNSIKGHTFTFPERIYAQNDSIFWISDRNAKLLVKMQSFKNEIREYDQIGDHIILVKDPQARHTYGAQKGILVDTRTHEIIETR